MVQNSGICDFCRPKRDNLRTTQVFGNIVRLKVKP